MATAHADRQGESAVGSGPNDTPQPCSSQVKRMVNIAPKDMVSPWAKLEKRSTP